MRATYEARIGDAVLRRLRGELGAQARDIVAARRALVRLTPATTRPLRSFRVGPAPSPERLLAWYRAGERRFGVPWHVLAAVNFVESAFGKLRSPSSAGAQGPMQFLPSTWRAYGLGGDIHEPRDAIMGAANYLRANGAPRTLWRALYRYNPSRLYVAAVIRLARVIRRDPRYFRAFHSWYVYVRTPAGPRRVTSSRLLH